MSARRVAAAAAWPVVQVGKGVATFAVWVWYMFLTSWPPTHAWMHMRNDHTHHKEEKD